MHKLPNRESRTVALDFRYAISLVFPGTDRVSAVFSEVSVSNF